MNFDKPVRAIETVRDRANELEEVAGADAVLGMRWAADVFETSLHDCLNEALTITQAALECHWAPATIAKKLLNGELEQAGKPGAPRVLRRDLYPRSSETDFTDIVAEVLGLDGQA